MNRLPPNFRPFISDIQPILKKYDEEMSYSEVNRLHNKISDILEDNNCQIYDLDNILTKYPKNKEHSSSVNKLKKIVRHRNKEMARQMFKSDKWNSFIKNLHKDISKEFTTKIFINDIQDSVFSILKEYTDSWEGFWTVASVNKYGKISNIGLMDLGYTDLIMVKIAKKYDWKLKDKDLENRLRKYLD